MLFCQLLFSFFCFRFISLKRVKYWHVIRGEISEAVDKLMASVGRRDGVEGNDGIDGDDGIEGDGAVEDSVIRASCE